VRLPACCPLRHRPNPLLYRDIISNPIWWTTTGPWAPTAKERASFNERLWDVWFLRALWRALFTGDPKTSWRDKLAVEEANCEVQKADEMRARQERRCAIREARQLEHAGEEKGKEEEKQEAKGKEEKEMDVPAPEKKAKLSKPPLPESPIGVVFHVGGRTERVRKLDLKRMQSFVGGFIWTFSIRPCVIEGVPVDAAVCNEEGSLRGLPVNSRASMYAETPLVGTVIFTCRKYV
jgi:hypothetical protein